MDVVPYERYAAGLNRKRTAAGVLFRDFLGRVLLVEPSYKREWEIPGGAVEAHETPWLTAVREVREELGIDRPLGRLLVIDYVPEEGVMPEGLAFVFDGGILAEQDLREFQLAESEIVSIAMVDVDDVPLKVKSRLAGRIVAALGALDHGGVALCEDGRRVA